MSAERNDGGPAFPISSEAVRSMMALLGCLPAAKQEELAAAIAERSSGMTLRDYFAAKAMQGLLACPGSQFGFDAELGALEADARFAYALADAMLKARQA